MKAAAAIRALLVDDEVLARLALRQALGAHPEVAIVGECGNAADALQAVSALRPDLLFLDIRMPGLDGFGLLQAMERARIPMVVFATAYDEHAARAFDADAIDYLLKPIDQERFDRTMTRVRRHWEHLRQSSSSVPSSIPADGRWLQRLSVHVDEHIRVIVTHTIDWIAAEGNYVRIHAEGNAYVHRDTLQHLQDCLDPAQFVRIHRGTLVNVDRVREIHPLFNGNAEVVLRDGTRLALSRRYRAAARAALGLR